MIGMTTQERIEDICKLSGLSEDIVRRVMDAEKKSIVKSLRRGERANIIGRAVIRPEVKRKLAIGGEFETYIKLNATAASSLEAMMEDLESFENERKVDETGIITQQIESLN